jgi:hypothetical protein
MTHTVMHLPLLLIAPFGASFPTTDACMPETVAVAVQLLPHTKPVGQHPPPSLAAQLDHPVAHTPVKMELAVRPLDAVTMMVTPLLSISVARALVGHEVGAQSLPRRQQPPW